MKKLQLSHEHAVNLIYTCMRIARRVQPADISEGSLNFQVPRNNNIDSLCAQYNKSCQVYCCI